MNIDIQQTIYDNLLNNSVLRDLLASFTYENGVQTACIFNSMPQDADNSIFPCVVIDAQQDNILDTDTTNGFNSTVLIHTWSVQPSNIEVSAIQDQIYNSLHRKKGGLISGISCELSEILRDPDGISRHGVQRFRIFYDGVAI
jgi:hypothetical protein